MAIDTVYYSKARRDVASLLPEVADRILEIGSGTGATISWLRERWPTAHFTGIDCLEEAREELAQAADVSFIADLDRALPQLDRYDLILALDVLEHLVDPWTVLRNLADHLTDDGLIIVSVPNVSRLSVSLPLLLSNQFRYTADGILDRTHLRFFTPETAAELVTGAGLAIEDARLTGLGQGRPKLLNTLSFGLLRRHLGIQSVMRARKNGRFASPAWAPI